MKIELIYGTLKESDGFKLTKQNQVVNVILDGVSTFVDASLFKSKDIKKFLYELEISLNSLMEVK